MDAVPCHVVFGEHDDEVVLQFVADVEWSGAELCVIWDFFAEARTAPIDGADDDELMAVWVVCAVDECFSAEEVRAGIPCGERGFEAYIAVYYEGVPLCGLFLLAV